MATLLQFFGSKRLSEVNGALCRQYANWRGEGTGRRRELEDLRAAINYHNREGLSTGKPPPIVLPEKPAGRVRWLRRAEAAKLIHHAWRHREKQLGNLTERHTRRHIARFVLVALYTGSRAGAICAAALQPEEGTGWVDLHGGVFYRRAEGARVTKKRQPAIPLPRRLLAHLRRWKRRGQRYVVEWNGEPIARMAKGFRSAARSAGLRGVTPHVLRHTAATWLMQAGVPLWAAAGYLGMSVETLSRVYGHHHPDYLREARDAFDRPRVANTPAKTTRGRKANKPRLNRVKNRK
jgi:integrase